MQSGGAKPLHVALALSKLDRQRKARLCSSEGRRSNGELVVTAQPVLQHLRLGALCEHSMPRRPVAEFDQKSTKLIVAARF